MAKYEVLEESFINNSRCSPGDIVEYEGEAGPNLKPLKGKKAATEQKPDEDKDSELV